VSVTQIATHNRGTTDPQQFNELPSLDLRTSNHKVNIGKSSPGYCFSKQKRLGALLLLRIRVMQVPQPKVLHNSRNTPREQQV